MTVRVADPLANVTLNRKVNMPDGADAASLAIAVGLGIEV
jgi:Tfp pilus assembly PilM family ATPase